MADLERREDGTFAAGHAKRGGRRRGSLNKFTQLKDELSDVYHRCNGRQKLEELLEHDAPTFFRILASLQPRLKIQEVRDLEGTTDLSLVPTKDLLEALNFTAVQTEDTEESG
ncbi:MAG: hypothetical protein CME26_10390 [Gemmatimonadetes bacterium]|nr:hypothetical protein [Gemmatimonadota bacterium]